MGSKTLRKAVCILRKIADKGMYYPIREISSELSIPRSTVHRVCQALSDEGILAFDPRTKQYRWGPELIYISKVVHQTNEIRRFAVAVLHQIVAQLNETAQLVLYDNAKRQIIFTDEVPCNQPIRYHTPIGVPLPIYVGASGKSIMAFLPGKELEEIINSGLPQIRKRSTISAKRLKKDLKEIRMNGYAVTFGERTPGAVGIGCPIFNASANVIGGLVITIPAYRFQPELQNRFIKLLKEGSEHLTRLMGYPEGMRYPPP